MSGNHPYFCMVEGTRGGHLDFLSFFCFSASYTHAGLLVAWELLDL